MNKYESENDPAVQAMLARLKEVDAHKKNGGKVYSLMMRCMNCGSRGVSIFKCGIEARCESCPRCGCNTYLPSGNFN